MANEMNLSEKDNKQFFEEINRRSDRITTVTMLLYFAFGIVLSFFYDTYVVAIGIGTLCLAAYFITRALSPESSFSQYVASAVYAVFAAQFIYQMHGLFEMHFFVFVGTVLLITYQNWKLQIPLIVLVVIHHATFAYLQYTGMKEIYFTQLSYMTLQAFIFHGLLASVISFLCGSLAYYLRRKTIASGANAIVFEKQIASVKNNIAFAEEISKGNLTIDYQVTDASDELGHSLMTMRKNLLESSQREQREKFITAGIAQVGDIIRKHSDSVQSLSDEFVQGIVSYLGINQAGLFLLDTIDNEEVLTLTACYAFERKKYLTRHVSKGEGLVGQCFQGKEMIYLTKVPNDYARITSGLGGANPSSVLLMPVMTSEEIVGVLELASFKLFEDNHIEFVKKAAENVASSIISSRTTERIRKLLTESQQQTEVMRSQEEEMRQNMEEMQATQEEMQRASSEIESRVEAIDNSGIASIEFELNGTIVTANNAFLKLLGYSLSEIQGKHHRIFVKEDYANSPEYKKFWRDLAAGIAQPGEYQRIHKKGTTVYINGSYSIIRDKNGNPKRVLKLASDITGSKMQMIRLQEQEEEMKQNMEEMQATQEQLQALLKESKESSGYMNEVLNSSKDSIFTIDRNLRVISWNKTFEAGVEAMGINLEKGFCILDLFAFDESKQEQQRLNYDRALKGDGFEVTESYEIDGKESFYVSRYSPLRKENGEVFAVAVMATDVTELTQARKYLAALKK